MIGPIERPSITICFQARSGKFEPGNGVETDAFDDGGVFGEKHCNGDEVDKSARKRRNIKSSSDGNGGNEENGGNRNGNGGNENGGDKSARKRRDIESSNGNEENGGNGNGDNGNGDNGNGGNGNGGNGGKSFDYSTLKTMINKKHFKICYGFEPSMHADETLTNDQIKKSRPKVLQLGNNSISIMLKNKTLVTEIGKEHT